jgi:glycosyltransferase involved in cell wall biosynthesis
MDKPTLHLLGLSHTVPSARYSHCAYTGRVLRFAKMMQPFGYKVIEYSNEGSESQADEHCVMLTSDEMRHLPMYPENKGDLSSETHKRFTERLMIGLHAKIKPGDIICHPFGIEHAAMAEVFPEAFHVEIGVGYTQCFSPLRIYESYAWWSWHQGKEQRPGNAYEFVCPMGYDLDEWPVIKHPQGDYFLYFGRIEQCKGLQIIVDIARNSDHKIIICGEGDPEPWLRQADDNFDYLPPVYGKDRAALLGNAKGLLMPTLYHEPFGGAGVEGQLCGTPLIASDFGAFSETVRHGLTGYRCKTLGDWLNAMNHIDYISRDDVQFYTRDKFNLHDIGNQYDAIFQQIAGLKGLGWYGPGYNAIWY